MNTGIITSLLVLVKVQILFLGEMIDFLIFFNVQFQEHYMVYRSFFQKIYSNCKCSIKVVQCCLLTMLPVTSSVVGSLKFEVDHFYCSRESYKTSSQRYKFESHLVLEDGSFSLLYWFRVTSLTVSFYKLELEPYGMF